MDATARQTIAYGTLTASTVSAIATGIYGTFKGHHGILAASAALNSGITAATFFTIRECAVSPFLVATLTSTQHPQHKLPTTWSEFRWRKLLDSGISGGATGGLLNGLRRGLKGIVPGITTGSFVCTILQFAYNEACITRIKLIGSRLPQELPKGRNPSHPLELPHPFKEKVMALLGLHQLSDDEKLTKLKRARDAYLQEIEKLEQKNMDEKRSTSEDV